MGGRGASSLKNDRNIINEVANKYRQYLKNNSLETLKKEPSWVNTVKNSIGNSAMPYYKTFRKEDEYRLYIGVLKKLQNYYKNRR